MYTAFFLSPNNFEKNLVLYWILEVIFQKKTLKMICIAESHRKGFLKFINCSKFYSIIFKNFKNSLELTLNCNN